MKKRFISIALCIFFIASFSNFTYAKSKVTLNSGLKVNIEGKLATFTNKPITVSSETLLYSVELLTKLGVPNDSKHIIFNKTKTSLTFYIGKAKVQMTANNKKAYVSGKSTTLTVAPVVYNKKLYIPAKSTAGIFKLKYITDKISNSAYFRNTSDFNKVKSLLSDTIFNMSLIQRYKSSEVGNAIITTNLGEGSMKMNVKQTTDVICDIKNKLCKADAAMTMLDDLGNSLMSSTVYGFYTANMQYTKLTPIDSWTSLSILDENYDSAFSFIEITASDSASAGLIAENKSNETVLKGNVLMGTTIQDFIGPDSISFTGVQCELHIDKTQNIATKLILKGSGSSSGSKFTSDYTYTYTDIDGDYTVTKPDGIN